MQDADERPALEAQAFEQRIQALEQRLAAEGAARVAAEARAAAEAAARGAAEARERAALQLLQQQHDCVARLLQEAAHVVVVDEAHIIKSDQVRPGLCRAGRW